MCAFFQRVLLVWKFCFCGAICLMRDISFLFHSFSKSYQRMPSSPPQAVPPAESHSPGPALCWFHQEGRLGSRTVPHQPPSARCSAALFSPSRLLSGSAFCSGSLPFVMTGATYTRWEPLWGNPGLLILLGRSWFLHRKPHVPRHPQSRADWKGWSAWCWIDCSSSEVV